MFWRRYCFKEKCSYLKFNGSIPVEQKLQHIEFQKDFIYSAILYNSLKINYLQKTSLSNKIRKLEHLQKMN